MIVFYQHLIRYKKMWYKFLHSIQVTIAKTQQLQVKVRSSTGSLDSHRTASNKVAPKITHCITNQTGNSTV